MSDSIRFDITSNQGIEHAIAIAFQNAPGGKASHFKVESLISDEIPEPRDVPRLILGWGDRPISGGFMLPFPLQINNNSAVEFVKHWLDDATYPREEHDFDGSTGKGWRVYNEGCGRIGRYTYAFVAIEPVLMYYGK